MADIAAKISGVIAVWHWFNLVEAVWSLAFHVSFPFTTVLANPMCHFIIKPPAAPLGAEERHWPSRSNGPKNNGKKLKWLVEPIEIGTLE